MKLTLPIAPRLDRQAASPRKRCASVGTLGAPCASRNVHCVLKSLGQLPVGLRCLTPIQGAYVTFSRCQNATELIHQSDHFLFGETVAFHREPDQWVSQQVGKPHLIVRSSTHGGRPPTAVREQRRRHPMSGRCPNGDRLCHFAAPHQPVRADQAVEERRNHAANIIR